VVLVGLMPAGFATLAWISYNSAPAPDSLQWIQDWRASPYLHPVQIIGAVAATIWIAAHWAQAFGLFRRPRLLRDRLMPD
jgi:hypothetical protein